MLLLVELIDYDEILFRCRELIKNSNIRDIILIKFNFAIFAVLERNLFLSCIWMNDFHADFTEWIKCSKLVAS